MTLQVKFHHSIRLEPSRARMRFMVDEFFRDDPGGHKLSWRSSKSDSILIFISDLRTKMEFPNHNNSRSTNDQFIIGQDLTNRSTRKFNVNSDFKSVLKTSLLAFKYILLDQRQKMSIYCRSRTKNDIILFWLLRIESWKRILIGRKLKSSSLAKTNMVITSCIIMCILMQRYIIWNDRLFLSSEHQENMLKLYFTVLQSLEIKA